MRVRLSDPGALPALVQHLALQGFPAVPAGRDEVDVLFPAQPTAFAPAVELERWQAENEGVRVTLVTRPQR